MIMIVVMASNFLYAIRIRQISNFHSKLLICFSERRRTAKCHRNKVWIKFALIVTWNFRFLQKRNFNGNTDKYARALPELEMFVRSSDYHKEVSTKSPIGIFRKMRERERER